MLYKEEVRDLFQVNPPATGTPYCLAHCISADFGMSGGIVVEFNRRWDMKTRLVRKYGNKEQDFHRTNGLVLLESVKHNGVDITVFNMVTKATLRNVPTYKSVANCLNLIKSHMLVQGYKRLAIPKIGCGIDGLNWVEVSKIVQETFEDTDIEVLVCKLEKI